MIKYEKNHGRSSDIEHSKRPYNAPILVVFGQVTALTLGQSTCGANDSASCTLGSNMGPKMVA